MCGAKVAWGKEMTGDPVGGRGRWESQVALLQGASEIRGESTFMAAMKEPK